MSFREIILGYAVLALMMPISTSAQETSSAPFVSVLKDGQAVLARLPAQIKMQLTDGAGAQRLSKPGESFVFHAGTKLVLTERHASYQVSAELTPVAGLQITATTDMRSIGRGMKTERYFVAAQAKPLLAWRAEFANLAPGMTRVAAEAEIARVRAIPSAYELWAMDTSAVVPYRLDAETVLLVNYKPGTPAAHGLSGQGGHPPVDALLLDFQVLKVW